MQRRLRFALSVLTMIAAGLLTACGSGGDDQVASLPDDGRLRGSDTETRPQRQVYTMESWDSYSRSSGGADTNTNQAFELLDLLRPARTMRMDYAVLSVPALLRVDTLLTIGRSAAAWESAAGDSSLFSTGAALRGFKAQYDGTNLIGWGNPRDYGLDPDIVAATFLYYVDGRVVEADILLSTRVSWSINVPIVPGDDRLGIPRDAYDLQAAVTNTLGHVLALGHVASDYDDANGDEYDATMCHFCAPGVLKMQTLTPGDIAGVRESMAR